MNIYLIRHGRQDSKLCNVDVKLAPEGREQADLLGKRLKTYNIEAVYSSDLIRAKETADIINSHLNVKRVIDDRWTEAYFGDMTGRTNEEINEIYGSYLEKRATMVEDMPYPGGGENCQMVCERVMPALKDLAGKGYENVCVVTHGGVLRALTTHIMGADYKNWLRIGRQIENCSITELLYDENKDVFHLERFNDYAHFEGKDYLLRKHFGTGFFAMKGKEEEK